MEKRGVIVLISMVIFLLIPGGVIAVTYSCGDDLCTTNVPGYQENNPLHITYCPMDCGGSVDKAWCKQNYSLIEESECPVCPTCATCPTCEQCTTCPTCKTCATCENLSLTKTNSVVGTTNASSYSCGGC